MLHCFCNEVPAYVKKNCALFQISLGAALTKVVTKDKEGKKADVVLFPANPKDNVSGLILL